MIAPIQIFPFRSVPAEVRALAARSDAPWRWAALLSNAGARLFWGDVNFKGPARPGSIARGMDENVLFDAHVLSATERVVFFTDENGALT
jgi:hypothetical protein